MGVFLIYLTFAPVFQEGERIADFDKIETKS